MSDSRSSAGLAWASGLLLLVFVAGGLLPHVHAVPIDHDHVLCAGELGERRDSRSAQHDEPCLLCRVGRARVPVLQAVALPCTASTCWVEPVPASPVSSSSLDQEAARAPPHISALS